MTRYERDIMTDNNIAPDLMEQIGKYLKQKRRARSEEHTSELQSHA